MPPNDFIPNQWYPIFDSMRLKRRKPVGVTRLGEQLVLWRDSSGAVVGMFDRCSHRAARLSLGWIHDDCLTVQGFARSCRSSGKESSYAASTFSRTRAAVRPTCAGRPTWCGAEFSRERKFRTDQSGSAVTVSRSWR
jgi:Rieske [2Fe-2S] domain